MNTELCHPDVPKSDVSAEQNSNSISASQAKYLTVNELAPQLHYHPVYLRQLCREGKIPFLKTNGKILFDPEAIRRWLRPSA